MTNAYSKPVKKGSEAAERIQVHVRAFPPPIAFTKSKVASTKATKDSIVKFKVWLDPGNENSEQMERAMQVFEDEDVETWCEFHRQFDDLVRLVPLDTTQKKEKAYEALLCGKALENYTTHWHCKTVQAQNEARRTRGETWDADQCLNPLLIIGNSCSLWPK